MQVPTRAEVEAMLAERLAADPGFRAALVADPRGAVSDLIGLPIPESVTVELHEAAVDDVHLTIPASEVLVDDDLELIAGGSSQWDGNCQNVSCGNACTN